MWFGSKESFDVEKVSCLAPRRAFKTGSCESDCFEFNAGSCESDCFEFNAGSCESYSYCKFGSLKSFDVMTVYW